MYSAIINKPPFMKKLENISFRFNNTITEEQLFFFNRYGIIQFKNFIDKATIGEYISEIENVQEYLLLHDIKKVNGIPLKFGADIDGTPLIQRIAFASHYSEKLS